MLNLLELAMRKIPMLLFLAAFLTLEAVSAIHAQAFVEIIGRKEPIPFGYKTYSLFLICNPAWLDPSRSSGLTDLFHQFQAFGRSIGDDQAAVWFWRTTVKKGWENTLVPTDVIDVERGTEFCKAWKLKPSDGPYLAVTTTRPDESNLTKGIPDGSAVFTLGAMNPSQISSLLAKLTDSLLLSGKVENSLVATSSSAGSTGTDGSPANPSAEHASSTTAINPSAATSALWIRMLSATQQIIGELGCTVSLKIDAGPLSADVKSCKGSS
jgi:hypothetical protein